MLQNKLKKAVIFLIAIIMSSLTFACDGNVFKKAIEPTYETGKKMQIATWIGAPELTKESYGDVVNAGYTDVYIGPEWNIAYDAQKLVKALDLCSQVGLKGVVTGGGGYKTPEGLDGREYTEPTSNEVRKGYPTKDFMTIVNHPAYGGHHFFDEPPVNKYSELADWYKTYNSYTSAPYYVVLLPSNGYPYFGTDEKGNKVTTYRDYLQNYADTVVSVMDAEDKNMSVDMYPMSKSGDKYLVRADYLSDLETLTDVAYKAGADVLFVIQTSNLANPPENTRVNKADVSFQYYTCMAYGISRFQNFVYTVPGWAKPNQDWAPIDKNGNKTQLYHDISEVHSNLKSFEHIFKSFSWSGVMTQLGADNVGGFNSAFDALTLNMQSHDRIESMSVSQDTLTGVFKDNNGNDGFMFVNYTTPRLNEYDLINVKFKDATKAIVISKGKKTVQNLDKGSLNITVEQGQGTFVIPY